MKTPAVRLSRISRPSKLRPVANPKVEALVDEILGLSLLEVSPLSDLLKDKLGLPDEPAGFPLGMVPGLAAPGGAPAAGGAGAEAPAEEKTTFDVKLKGFEGATKLKVIKEIRALMELGLKESKELVEGSEKEAAVLKSGLSKEEAEAIKEKLAAVGAKIEIE